MEDVVLQEVDWKDVCQLVEKANPEFAEIINNISPDNHYKLIKATYSFGDLIIKDGQLCLPIDNDKLRVKLNYSPIPLSFLLNKSSEVFLYDSGSSLPLNVLNPGDFFGTFEAIDFICNKQSCPNWNVSMGVRTTIMLPKINEASGIKRLRSYYNLTYNIQFGNLSDHWEVFRQIALKPNFTKPWKGEVLFFSKEWFTNREDPRWLRFYLFIYQKGWEQAKYGMSELNLRDYWQACIKMIDRRRLKPTSYILSTIKHLLAMIMGFVPSLKPANPLEQELPLTELQRAFTDIYLLENYWPTIMSPSVFKFKAPPAITYYSLSFPTLVFGFNPIVKLSPSLMSDLRTIKLIMDALTQVNEETIIFNSIAFEYFHVDKDKFNSIQVSHEIPKEDHAFEADKQRFPNRSFCSTSPFWRGSIRLSTQATEKR